jgi:hypothetical protein
MYASSFFSSFHKNKIFRLQVSNLSAHTTVKKTRILLFDKKIKTKIIIWKYKINKKETNCHKKN